ncbi:MAG: hypothetical protein J6Q12_04995, partial [Bacteroidales bacterium]|nr:hypothetical protein [Bacteroidales bacterium]
HFGVRELAMAAIGNGMTLHGMRAFVSTFFVFSDYVKPMARLSSLLNMFGLEGRLVHGIDPEDDGEYFLSDIDWEVVDEKLKAFREHSEKFLVDALSKR